MSLDVLSAVMNMHQHVREYQLNTQKVSRFLVSKPSKTHTLMSSRLLACMSWMRPMRSRLPLLLFRA